MPRLSKQPLLVTSDTYNRDELNDVLRRIQDELDILTGLRGTTMLYDSQHYKDDNSQVLHGYGVKP